MGEGRILGILQVLKRLQDDGGGGVFTMGYIYVNNGLALNARSR